MTTALDKLLDDTIDAAFMRRRFKASDHREAIEALNRAIAMRNKEYRKCAD